jgi:hypothetical protein
MAGLQLFICYSHRDSAWKEQLCDHLASIGLAASAWHDGNIRVGDSFEERIYAAIDAASLAIVLVSEHSLSSEFITQKEVPRLLARRASHGLRVMPVVVRPCAWRTVPWLASLELRPKGGTPLTSFSESDAHLRLAELVEEIHHLVRANSNAGAEGAPATPTMLRPASVSTGRLPPSGKTFLGRDDDLNRLDEAWKDPETTLVTVTAWAGVGKSALVNHWLGRMRRDKYRGAERVFGWSFDGQGGAKAASADPFFHAALSWFGESTSAESSWEKGERLAQAVQRSRSLMILDGLEPMQHPPGPSEGMLREEGLRAFLCTLAESNQGLCVVTSREPVLDLETYEPDPAVRLPLNSLAPATGVTLLRSLGVNGDEAELLATVQEYDGHCLALTLLGSFLADVFQGDVRRRQEVGPLTGDMRRGAQARRVLASYESWFGEGEETALLSWLSLWERPIDEQTLAALFQTTAAEAITRPLRTLSGIQWRQLLGRLQRVHLLRTSGQEQDAAANGQNPTLHLHPLVREYFRERLRTQPAIWQEANERLFDYLATESADLPGTLEELTPLYDAVRHGCWAGRRQEALEKIYWPRIRRKGEGYSTRKLGAFQADVAALSNFFAKPFGEVADDLPAEWRAPVLGWTGFRLFTLGRLKDATQALEAGYERLKQEGNIAQAGKMANHLFQACLARGEFRRCQAIAQQMLADADTEPAIDRRLWQVNYGLMLLQTGKRKEAEREFRKATPEDDIREEGHPLTPLCERLPHRQAIQLCQLLSEAGEPDLAEDYAPARHDSAIKRSGMASSGITLEPNADDGIFLEPDAAGLAVSWDPTEEELRALQGRPLSAEADEEFELSLEAEDAEWLKHPGDGTLDSEFDRADLVSSDFELPLDDSPGLEPDAPGLVSSDFELSLHADDDALDESPKAADEGSDVLLAFPSASKWDSGISLAPSSDSDVRLDVSAGIERPNRPTANDSEDFALTLDTDDDNDDDDWRRMGAVESDFEFSLVPSAPDEPAEGEPLEIALGAAERRPEEETPDLSRHLHRQLCTLLRAQAEITREEQQTPSPLATKSADADEEFELALPSEPRGALNDLLLELRRAGLPEFVGLALLIRSRHLRLERQADAALRDLGELEQLAAYYGYRLLLVDGLVCKSRLLLETGELQRARESLAQAARIVKETGYQRQVPEIQTLARRLQEAST